MVENRSEDNSAMLTDFDNIPLCSIPHALCSNVFDMNIDYRIMYMQMVYLYELTVIWETDVVTVTKWKQYQLHKFRAINVTWNSQPVVVIAF